MVASAKRSRREVRVPRFPAAPDSPTLRDTLPSNVYEIGLQARGSAMAWLHVGLSGPVVARRNDYDRQPDAGAFL